MVKTAFRVTLILFMVILTWFIFNTSNDIGDSITQMETTIQQLQDAVANMAASSHKGNIVPGSMHSAPKELTDLEPIPEPVIQNYFTAPPTKPGVEKTDAYLRLVFDRNKRPEAMKSFASVWTINLKPGGKNGPHAHGDEEQIYICVDGEVEFTFGGKHVRTLKDGDAVFLPKLYSHAVENKTGKPARVLAIGAYHVD